MVLIELTGFAGATLASVACVMRDSGLRRVAALIGSLCFLLYGLLIGSLPVLMLQFFILACCGSRLLRFLQRGPRRPDLGTPLVDVLAGSGSAWIYRRRHSGARPFLTKSEFGG